MYIYVWVELFYNFLIECIEFRATALPQNVLKAGIRNSNAETTASIGAKANASSSYPRNTFMDAADRSILSNIY